jgi:hypothetical protein
MGKKSTEAKMRQWTSPAVSDVVEAFENRVQSAVERHRGNRDRLVEENRCMEMKMERMRTAYNDLKLNAEAVVQSEDDDQLDVWAQKNGSIEVESEKERYKTKVLQFMKTREESIEMELRKRNRRTEEYYKAAFNAAREKQREKRAKSELLANARESLQSTKQHINENITQWRKLIAQRQEEQKLREEFATFCTRLLEEKEVEQDTITMHDKKKMLILQISSILKQKLFKENELYNDERMYEEAFERIGFSIGVKKIDPSAIIQRCLHHEIVNNELHSRQEKEQEKIDSLKEELAMLEKSWNSEFYGHERTSYRHVKEIENGLAKTLKERQACVDEYNFLNMHLQSVKLNLSHLSNRVLTMGMSLETDDHYTYLVGAIAGELRKLIKKRGKEPPPVAEKVKFNNHKSDFGLFPDAWSALEASLSRHNLRINILEVINRPGCNVWNIGENHVAITEKHVLELGENKKKDSDTVNRVAAKRRSRAFVKHVLKRDGKKSSFAKQVEKSNRLHEVSVSKRERRVSKHLKI